MDLMQAISRKNVKSDSVVQSQPEGQPGFKDRRMDFTSMKGMAKNL